MTVDDHGIAMGGHGFPRAITAVLLVTMDNRGRAWQCHGLPQATMKLPWSSTGN